MVSVNAEIYNRLNKFCNSNRTIRDITYHYVTSIHIHNILYVMYVMYVCIVYI